MHRDSDSQAETAMDSFLDIRGAYDNVNREKLWSQLREYGLDRKMIEFLQQVYTDNEVEITWRGNYKAS